MDGRFVLIGINVPTNQLYLLLFSLLLHIPHLPPNLQPNPKPTKKYHLLLLLLIRSLIITIHNQLHQPPRQLAIPLMNRKQTYQRISIQTRLNILYSKLVHDLNLKGLELFDKVRTLWAVDNEAVGGVELGLERPELLLSLVLVQKEQLLYPNQYLITQHIVSRPLTLIVYAKRTLITQMLLAVLTKFPRVVLLTLLANNLKHCLTVNLATVQILMFTQMVIISQVLLEARLALDNLALGTLYVNHVQVVEVLLRYALGRLEVCECELWVSAAEALAA